MALEFRLWRRWLREKIMFMIAWWLPKCLVYFVGIRLWAHATASPHGNVDATQITMDEVIKAWDEDHQLHKRGII